MLIITFTVVNTMLLLLLQTSKPKHQAAVAKSSIYARVSKLGCPSTLSGLVLYSMPPGLKREGLGLRVEDSGAWVETLGSMVGDYRLSLGGSRLTVQDFGVMVPGGDLHRI